MCAVLCAMRGMRRCACQCVCAYTFITPLYEIYDVTVCALESAFGLVFILKRE